MLSSVPRYAAITFDCVFHWSELMAIFVEECLRGRAMPPRPRIRERLVGLGSWVSSGKRRVVVKLEEGNLEKGKHES